MQEVLRLLETRESVHVSELAKAFSVSEVTIRSDLSELARQGLVARVRGGVRALQPSASELSFDVRLRLDADRTQAIARAAAAMVDAPEAVALDSRTTSMSLIGELGADVLRATRINKGFLGARGSRFCEKPCSAFGGP